MNSNKIAGWRRSNPRKRITTDVLLAILDRDTLCEADLRGADLSEADLCEADLSGANLCETDLSHTNLSGANLRGAVLFGADLSHANLCDADLSDAGWNGLQITGLPSGTVTLIPTPAGWSLRVGRWTGTPDSLRRLIAADTGWPEARGAEVARRRPLLEAALALVEAHMANRETAVARLAERWG